MSNAIVKNLSFGSDAKNNVFVINKNISLPLSLGMRPIFARLFDSATQCF